MIKSLVSVLALLLVACSPPPTDKYNIVLIFTDDQGYGDVGSFGATGFTTPNLDQMASEGMRFTNFYVAQAVCSASRAALMTGCYSNRVSILGALFPGAQIGLNEDEETIAELLQREGYATCAVGKWHLGDHQRFLPLNHGFDEYLGVPYSNDMWPVHYDGNRASEENVGSGHWKLTAPQLPLIEGNQKVDEIRSLEAQDDLTTRYTQKAVEFIEDHAGQPFFLYFAHSMPHVPLGVSDKFRGKSEQGMYGDVMMEIDWSVGQILATLEKQKIRERTLVIFTTDNGPWLNYGNHAGSAAGLREGKGTSWEGGQRVPCIMSWPGKIPEGSVCNRLAATIDLLPTIVEISGAAQPQKKIDGISVLPLLMGDSEANPRRVLYYYYGRNLEAVRKDSWKLVFPHPHRTYEGLVPGNDGWPGQTETKTAEFGLYDLRRDPGERYDVKELYPEIVSLLESEAEEARRQFGDGLTEVEGEEVRPAGKLEGAEGTWTPHLRRD